MSANSPFELVREKYIESMRLTAQEFSHIKTGAVHIHLASDNEENVFLVGLRTVPTDSTGVAHILEHTALCGSKKYPVRDPFFMMIRRSLNTFMNAFTSSDWTAYPFASENRKDFFNLLDVYLDAVFFSNLDELDFRQEGHRLDFAEEGNTASELVYKGIVFNEMKGALSSPTQKLWADLTSNLFQQSTYHYNSGGDPEKIVDLTYEQLKMFYQTHYHPSNAIFMTFGNIPVTELHEKIEEQALQHFDKNKELIKVDLEPRWTEPRKATSYYQVEDNDQPRSHHLLAWLIGDSTDTEAQLIAHLITSVLLDNSASPLRKVLEQTDLSLSPSPLCGLEESSRDMVFVCGLEGADQETGEQIEQLILDCLQDVIENGISQEHVDAALHQLELQQREIGGDHYPYGLQLILGSLPAAAHRGDALSVLDIDPVLNKLRSRTRDPGFIPELIRRLLVDNPHRLLFSMLPDVEYSQKAELKEKKRIQAIRDKLSTSDLQSIKDQAEKLAARQQSNGDPDMLPKVTLADVRPDIHQIQPVLSTDTLKHYKVATNGLSYLQLVFRLPELADNEIRLLPLLCFLIPELGAGEQDYLSIQEEENAVTGGINCWLSVKADLKDTDKLPGFVIISGKALKRNLAALENLLHKVWFSGRLDEKQRIGELLGQVRMRKEQSVTGSGHSLAMTAASGVYSAGAALSHALSGLESIQWIKEVHDKLQQDEAYIDELLQSLHELIVKLRRCPMQTLVVNDEDTATLSRQSVVVSDEKAGLLNSALLEGTKSAWLTNSQVNFCAKAYPTIPPTHKDSAALTVLAGVLRNGYLHRAIREQGGAYGGGASHDATNGVFRFFSYRDPRLEETLDDFDASVQWLLDSTISDQMLEESILGVIGSMDKPGSPAGDAKSEFHSELFGRTPDQRRAYRQQILNVTLEDLIRVAKTWLKDQSSAIAVVTNDSQEQYLTSAGFDLLRL